MTGANAVSSALSVELAKENLTAAEYKVIFYLLGVLLPDGEYRAVDPKYLAHVLGIPVKAATDTLEWLGASGFLQSAGPYLLRWNDDVVRAGE